MTIRQTFGIALLLALAGGGLVSWFDRTFPTFDDETGEPDPLSTGALATLADEAVRSVEAYYGRSFEKRPAVHASTRQAIQDRLYPLARTWFAERHPDIPWLQVMRMAHEYAQPPDWAWGIYSPVDHAVYLMRDEIRLGMIAIGYVPTAKPRVVCLLLVHELAHAMDHEIHGEVMPDRFPDEEAREAFQAVVEGHAEHVTRQIADLSDDWSLFDDWADRLEHADEEQLCFRYVRGREFVEALTARGPLRMDLLFAHPPAKAEVILGPDAYVYPTDDGE